MMLPAVALLFVYSYLSMIGNLMAFEKFSPAKGIFLSQWTGWQNFKYVLEMPDTLQVLYNTFFISLMKIIAGVAIPVAMALLLNEVGRKRYKRTIQTIVYFPHFLSWVILSGVLIDVLSPSTGIVNTMLSAVGIKPIFFLGDAKWFPYTLVLTESWKEFGFGTIIYLAALTGIDPTLYEAAMMDGANRWRQTMHITLPSIMPIVMLMAILWIGNILNAGAGVGGGAGLGSSGFEQVFNLYSPQVYRTGDILDTLVYRIGMVDAQYGVATAVGLFKSVVAFSLLSLSYALAYKYTDYRLF